MTKTLCMTGATWLLACAIAVPASGGDNDRIVPLFSDQRGNKAWVQVERAAGRTKATPFVAVSGDDARKGAQKLGAGEKAAVPLPAILRFVEQAREAFRGKTRPAPQTPPDAVAPKAAETEAPANAAAAGTPAGDRLEAAPTRCAGCDLHGAVLDPGADPAPVPGTPVAPPAASPADRTDGTAPQPAALMAPIDRTDSAIHPPLAMYSPAGL